MIVLKEALKTSDKNPTSNDKQQTQGNLLIKEKCCNNTN
jgi:hypothetical protein